MNTQGWEIRIAEDGGFFSVRVWIFSRTNGRLVVAYFDDKGNITEKEIPEGSVDPEPSLVMPQLMWSIFKSQLIDDKVRDKQEVEAELKATTYHLEDMRKLVFKIK